MIPLLMVLGIPLLPWALGMGNPIGLGARLVGQLFYFLAALCTLLVVKLIEKRPLSSIGLRRPSRDTFFGALLASLLLVQAVCPFALWLVAKLGLGGFEQGLATVSALPIWFRFLAIVVTGGFFEEVVYRGFAIERLSELTGSETLGGTLALSVFAWIHYPMWGLGPVITFYISGGFLTLLYLWKRDLWMTMLCHVIVDSLGLLFLPHGVT